MAYRVQIEDLWREQMLDQGKTQLAMYIGSSDMIRRPI